ncbi:MAG: hypothetical protein A2Y64_07800 [Candidatus Coatesbacteria bacterium RBG_13_66_14]|uniref:DUF202 domain-containing protein n=1 Tax=Candidatus Coatesbacteria bacterium RBG_13_66_14 TaxID=1817816 RepID=A0A1F5FB04_9BACT|nr:MAG: hypothetical protein A2Y64_07800 [Candidatus Coatesbacteria bacterium RBG_13_66_14]
MIRDKLAAHRNLLAGERTLLAYIRTALGFGAVSVTLLHFLGDYTLYQIIGWVFLPLGAATLAIGIWRYTKTRRLIPEMYRREKRKGRKVNRP